MGAPNREWITIYAPDGQPLKVAPVDAREIVEGGGGYSYSPPVSTEVANDASGNHHESDSQEEAATEAQAVEPVPDALKVTKKGKK